MEFSNTLTYVGIGAASVLGILIVIWGSVAFTILRKTKGLPQALNNFFAAVVTGNIDAAYQMTTQDYRRRVNRKTFVQFIKKNQLKQYKRTKLAPPKIEGEAHALDITVELSSGKEVPLSFVFLKNGEQWAIESLQSPRS